MQSVLMENRPIVQDFFDENSKTFSYIVSDPITQHCAIIDSVLDYDEASATTSTTHADRMITYIHVQGLTVDWILETHIHADHLTAAHYLKAQLGGKIAMSQKMILVQETFSPLYHLDPKAWNTQQPFDYLFTDHEHFNIGDLDAYNIPTPGHTPACLSYVIRDVVFVGDTLFMPDYGSARCDFRGGSAASLFDSAQKLYLLPADTRVFLCHDYLPPTRQHYVCETNIQTQKMHNIHLHADTKKAEFVAMRQQRDATLSMPKLILPAIQFNMKAGQFPEPESNGIAYLKLPLNVFK